MASLAATNSVVMPLVSYSWRWSFTCYGVMTFIFACIWWFFTKDVHSEIESELLNPIRVLGKLSKIPSVRVTLICGAMAFGIAHGYQSWLPKILETKGFSPVTAGLASAVPFIASIPAALAIPRLVPVHLRGRIIALFALMAGISIMWVVATPLPPIHGLLLFGASSSLMPLLVLTLIENPEVESNYLGSATGVFFCVAEIGGFFGPFIVGYLVDLYGTFLVGAIFLFTLGTIIFGFMIFPSKNPAPTNKNP
jgi:cyanate permease